ncbi:MAG: hypothetical protein IMZ50_05745, partial [Candidatus Atribacteria bacterium]|nr:hypothetical protein [Candidatus Atribacteria bacterium]
MPGDPESNNPFLLELLGLQQDGRQAISAPTNWTQSRPLLEVPTELDAVVADLATSCLAGGPNAVGRWHFFIGSPGNGKSAAVGQLVRTLLNDRGCTIVDDNGTDIGQLAGDSVPYWLGVFEAGCNFPSVRIVQDASVVRNPYAADVDPARDLLDTLREAWERGISLIVCTNRGVLEKAFRDTYLDPTVNQQAWHKAILRPLADSANGTELSPDPIPTTGRRPVFASIRASTSFLDSRSLILCGRGIFDGIIQQAVRADKWAACSRCPNAALCPFKANRDWLADDAGRGHVVKAFRRAEVLSSQVIVFREALAAISFLLAGCARDYHATHPCDWVRGMVARGDVFGLATRRVYMALFSSGFPRGLEASKELRTYQIGSLQALRGGLAAGTTQAALTSALDTPAPSTDVGISRLLGSDGVFSHLDAVQGPLPSSFFDAWDGSYDRIKALGPPFISEIERQCVDAWYALETAAEHMPSHAAADAYWAVRRWSTQFTLHLGALVEGRAYAADQVDEFSELLELLWKDKNVRTIEERRRLRELEQLVERLLNRDLGQGGGVASVQVAENVQVSGRWVEREMRPRVDASPA